MRALASKEWWDISYNPFWGCSNGTNICAVHDDCWARSMIRRFHGGKYDAVWRGDEIADTRIRAGEVVSTTVLEQPFRWHKPRYVFYASMADLYCEIIPPQWRRSANMVIADNGRHTFMALTKRPDRINPAEWKIMQNDVVMDNHPGNLWLGVSVCHPTELQRIHTLYERWPGVRFVSFEPLMEAIDDWWWLSMVDWVIIGGRSGAHPLNVVRFPAVGKWVSSIKSKCEERGIPLWMKRNLKMDECALIRERPQHSLRR